MTVADQTAAGLPSAGAEQGELRRGISWTGAFWIASGVPAFVLFSIGSVGAKVGGPAWIIWAVSIFIGFVQAFSYAEIAGLFPQKSGGASVYGAVAWVRYNKLFAPLSVWCNWLGWSPVLALGTSLAAGNILNALFGADAPISQWHIEIAHLNFVRSGLTLRVDAVFLLSAAMLLFAYAVQDRGIGGTARMQVILGVVALTPLLIIGVVPLLTGGVKAANLAALHPLALGPTGHVMQGRWDLSGVTLMAAGLFLAGWSTYGFETAVCYTREFRDPKRDTVRAIIYCGLLCLLVFTIVPLSFQGVIGVGDLIRPQIAGANGVVQAAQYSGILSDDINSGSGVAKAMAGMVHAGAPVEKLIVALLVMAMLLTVITAMAGSSRTLYQASVEGWFPKYLSKLNKNGAPTSAMRTDLLFNIFILLLSDSAFILIISNICYIIFHFINLNAAWIHRRDRPNWERPYRAPSVVLAAGTVLAFGNLALLGMGADSFGKGTLLSGLVVVAAVVPIFLFRHYITDKGVFPPSMSEDLHTAPEAGVSLRSGRLVALAVAAGVAVVCISRALARF